MFKLQSPNFEMDIYAGLGGLRSIVIKVGDQVETFGNSDPELERLAEVLWQGIKNVAFAETSSSADSTAASAAAAPIPEDSGSTSDSGS